MKYLLIIGLLLIGCAKKPEPKKVNHQPIINLMDEMDSYYKEPDPDPVPVPVLTFQNILFDFDSSELNHRQKGALFSADNIETLRDLADHLKAHRHLTAQVIGHACELGSDDYNLALSVQRSSTVLSYLVDLGVSTDRVQVLNYGETKPLGGPHELDRRVEIVVE